MRIKVCDVCYKNKMLEEATGTLKVKGKSYLNLDVCKKHTAEFNGMPMAQYEKFVVEEILGIKATNFIVDENPVIVPKEV